VIIDALANDNFEDPGAQVSAVSAGSHGTVTINPDGTLTYLPEPDYYGADSFTAVAADHLWRLGAVT
jgi:hypothetical protein